MIIRFNARASFKNNWRDTKQSLLYLFEVLIKLNKEKRRKEPAEGTDVTVSDVVYEIDKTSCGQCRLSFPLITT